MFHTGDFSLHLKVQELTGYWIHGTVVSPGLRTDLVEGFHCVNQPVEPQFWVFETAATML